MKKIILILIRRSLCDRHRMLAADLHDERNSEFGSAGCCLLPGESNSVIL